MNTMFITFQLAFRESWHYVVLHMLSLSPGFSRRRKRLNIFCKGCWEGKLFYYFVYRWFINRFPDTFLGL